MDIPEIYHSVACVDTKDAWWLTCTCGWDSTLTYDNDEDIVRTVMREHIVSQPRTHHGSYPEDLRNPGGTKTTAHGEHFDLEMEAPDD